LGGPSAGRPLEVLVEMSAGEGIRVVQMLEGAGFRVSSGGTYVSGVFAPPHTTVARCVSFSLTHLSLSLSLSSAESLAARARRRASAHCHETAPARGRSRAARVLAGERSDSVPCPSRRGLDLSDAYSHGGIVRALAYEPWRGPAATPRGVAVYPARGIPSVIEEGMV
jgi:hypothetical protein